MSETSGLTRVVLRLGRNPDHGFPEGDDHHGYVIHAPLDREGMLDPTLWAQKRDQCAVRRFHAGEPAVEGLLRHRGDNWYISYDNATDEPAEPLFKLGSHRLRPGEYVTVREADGDVLTFRIAEAVALP